MHEEVEDLRSAFRTLATLVESMMESEGWPLDAASAASLVVRAVDDIDRRQEAETNVLLSDLLCAAWPTCWAQDQ
jgi:hypothetical protein